MLIAFIKNIIMKLRGAKQTCAAFTVMEAAFAAALVALFFVSLFALNTRCLYLVKSSRELTMAGQAAQSRLEQIRGCTWDQITDSSFIKTGILNSASLGAPTLGALSEVVTVNAYPTAVNPVIQVTRASNGTVTVNTTNSAIQSGAMATVSVQLSWKATFEARQKTLVAGTTYAKNTQ
jgi:hypothetical protein